MTQILCYSNKSRMTVSNSLKATSTAA
jgi:hypothetical protein